MSSEDHVLQLMQLIDEAIKEVCLIEERLASYDQVIVVSYRHHFKQCVLGGPVFFWKNEDLGF